MCMSSLAAKERTSPCIYIVLGKLRSVQFFIEPGATLHQPPFFYRKKYLQKCSSRGYEYIQYSIQLSIAGARSVHENSTPTSRCTACVKSNIISSLLPNLSSHPTMSHHKAKDPAIRSWAHSVQAPPSDHGDGHDYGSDSRGYGASGSNDLYVAQGLFKVQVIVTDF